jgi:transposase
MDNASIHTGQEADIAEDLLWEASQVLVVFLPTRSPELTPIELVFHILSRRIRFGPTGTAIYLMPATKPHSTFRAKCSTMWHLA